MASHSKFLNTCVSLWNYGEIRLRKGKKDNVMLYLDPNVVREARELGLNLSKVCENALKEAIRRLKGENPQNNLDSKLSEG